MSFLNNYEVLILDINGVIWPAFEQKNKLKNKNLKQFITDFPIKKETILFFKYLSSLKKKVIVLSNLPISSKIIANSFEKNGLCKDYYNLIYTSGDSLSNFVACNYSKFTKKNYLQLTKSNYDLSNLFDFQPYFIDSVQLEVIKKLDVIKYDFILTHDINCEPNEVSQFEEKILFLLKETKLPLITMNTKPYCQLKKTEKYSGFCVQNILQKYSIPQERVINIGKPHTNIYNEALSLLEETCNKKILIIGDGVTKDLVGANEIGADCILISQNIKETESNVKKYNFQPPLKYLNCLEDLVNY